jgi:FkbM family methyltransferase
MNGLDWLKTYPAAAAARQGTSELLTYGNLGSTTTHLRYHGETVGESAAPLPVRTLSLDDEVDAGRLRVPQFVKIDVEGSAHGAVLGMERSLAASRPTLLVAFHDDSEVSGVLSVLDPLGYDRAPVAPQSRPGSMVGGDFWFTPRRPQA